MALTLVLPAQLVPAGASRAAEQDDEITWADDVPLIESPELEPEVPTLPAGRESAGTYPEPHEGTKDGAAPEPDRVEVVEERAADRRVFELPDGSREVEFYAGPRLFEEPDGSWELIDTELVPDQDGAVLRSAANSWTARFAPATEGGLTIEDGETSVTLDPVAPEAVAPQADEEEASTAVYDDVWPDAKLEYTVGQTTVQQRLVIDSPEAGPRFNLELREAAARAGEDGIELVSGDRVYLLSESTVTDAEGNDVTEAAKPTVLIEDESSLAITLDAEWLASAASSIFPLSVSTALVVTLPGPWAARAESYNNGNAR
ncbi:hypothetical protein [Microbacterium album]|uniref:hypothetical protein n=1 Tax=Microbacterium album TaxID=2053191 RepID=UPI0016675785|nr:hypothetical protein [Microbacterium album]